MLNIEIVSDFVCPWCFIGLRRLSAAVDLVRRDVPGFACRKRWRPFFLNPNTPPEGEPYLPFLEHKFGSRQRVDALFANVRQAGAAYGLEYAFEKIQVRANTLDAHRLVHWAQSQGDAEALVERLFVGQFQRGENVGDRATLCAIAAEVGLEARTVAAYLASGMDTAQVRRLERESRASGVSSVPTFLVDSRHVVVGAEDPAILARAIRQALI